MFCTIKNMKLGAVALVCAATAYGQSDQDIVRLDLNDSSRERPPDTLSVYVDIATVQPDVAQGIVFTLNIENTNAETVRIMDPIDGMSIGLHGLTRQTLGGLRDTNRFDIICSSGSSNPEQIKAIFDAKRARKPFQAYDIDEARRNQRLKTVSDIMPWEPPPHRTEKVQREAKPLSQSELFDARVGGKLILEPGQRFQAVLQVTQVYSDYENYKKTLDQWLSNYLIPDGQGKGTIAADATQRPEPEIITIPSGKYSLSVSIILSTDNVGSHTASSESITIQLGEPNSQ